MTLETVVDRLKHRETKGDTLARDALHAIVLQRGELERLYALLREHGIDYRVD